LTFQYDDKGQVEKRIHSIFHSATEFAYNESAQLLSCTDGNGTEYFSWYNNNLTRDSIDLSLFYSYSYNDHNECTRMSVNSPAVKSIYVYNENHLLDTWFFYDEVHLVYIVRFTWEQGKSNFDFQNVCDSLIYQYDYYWTYGLP
jgi:hypothetical protein